MPENVLEKVWSYFDAIGPRLGREWPVTYRTNEQRRLETLRSLGVRRFTAMIYPHKPDMAEWLNAWSADFRPSRPGLPAYGDFFPELQAKSYVSAEIADGAQVFKAHLQVGRYDPRTPLLNAVWAQLAEMGYLSLCTQAPGLPLARIPGRPSSARCYTATLGCVL